MAESLENLKRAVDSGDEDDGEGWHEVMDEEEYANVKCVFCDEIFKTVGALWQHCADRHHFHITNIKQKFNLDFYGYIKLVNFLRKVQPSSKTVLASVPPYPWDDDMFLQPVLPDDPLLHIDIEDSDHEDDVCEDAIENGSCSTTADENLELKKRVQLAEERASKSEMALHQAISDLEVMRAGFHSIILDTDHNKEILDTGEPHHHNVDEDDGYFSTYAHYSIHEEMLKDEVRTLSYKNFIEKNRQLFEDKVVLDVGCGTGILSIFAAKAGAKKVIGIDKSLILYNAMDIVRENKYQHIVNLVRGKVEEVNLEVGQVDVIISEWMGYFLLFESMLDSVLVARDKWLGTNGKVYPDKCTMGLVGLSDQRRTEQKLTYWDDVYGVKMTCMKHFVLSEPIIDVVDPNFILTKDCIIKEIDINNIKKEELDFKSVFQLEATQNGVLNIIVGYFNIFFDENCTEKITFSTHPTSSPTHWKQCLFYLETPMKLKAGEVLHGTIQCSKNTKDIRALDIVIELKDNVSNEIVINKYILQ